MKRRIMPIAVIAMLTACTALAPQTSNAAGNILPAQDPILETFANVPTELAKRLDPIYFHVEQVEGLNVMVPNPTAEIERGLIELEKQLPKEPLVPLFLSSVQITLGKSREANAAMEQFVKLSGRNPQALGTYADYLQSRIMFAEEVKVLEERAQSYARGGDADKQKAKDDYLRIIGIIFNRNLTAIDRFDYYRKIVAMLPDDSGSAMEYVDALSEAGRIDDALREAEKFSARFPKNRQEWISERAALMIKAGRVDDAIGLYETLEPLDSSELYSEYFNLLNSRGKVGEYRRRLDAARLADSPADAKTMAAWFRLMNWMGEDYRAEKGIKEWISKLEAAGKLKENLEMAGELLLQSYRAGSASPYFYTLYATSKNAGEREKALYGLFRSLTMGDEDSAAFSIGTAPGPDLLGLDNLPSVGGGVLSLILNDRDLEKRKQDLDGTARAYRNRIMAAHVADEMRRAFPRSDKLPDMDWTLLETARIYSDWKALEDFADAFAAAHPMDDRYFDSLFAIAESRANRGMFNEEEQAYRRILKEAAGRGDEDSYWKGFNSYTAFLTGRKRYVDVLGLYWEEIGRRPENEKLYEEFLAYAQEHELFDQELKVYQRAIARFDDPSWYNKMARWYLRQQGEDALREITLKIREKLDESALGDYLGEFVHFNWNDVSSADSRFYLESYLYAHNRFPHNLGFVRALISYYDGFYRRGGLYYNELEALQAEYFIFAPDIRIGLMRLWMAKGRLEKVMDSLASKNDRNGAETFMLTWGRRWLADHEGAVGPLAGIVDSYPGSTSLVEEAASLDRSLAHTCYGDYPERTASAVKRYLHLAELYPSNTQYPTLAGEVLVENGEPKRAIEMWMKILDVGPGMPDLYKEVASILWDYYRFDDAAAVLEKIRKIRNDPRLFSVELAAIYESKGDYASAVNEYVAQHSISRHAAWESLSRLDYLTDHKNLGPQIEKAYKKEIASDPDNPDVLLAYRDYLVSVGRYDDALQLLADSLGKYNSREFVDECISSFSDAARYDLLEKAYLRLIALTGGEYDTYANLATFYESRKNWQKAEDTYLKLVQSVKSDDVELQVRATEELASFYWRRERYDDALKYYRQAAMLVQGPRREAMLHSLAQRYIQRGRLDDAAEILLKLIEAHPNETSYFNTLAQVYTKRNDQEALVELYKQAIQNLRKASMTREERKSRLSGLRQGLARSQAALGRNTEALDQYIEAINLYPLDEYLLDTVYRFAVDHDLLDRLRGYYDKTAKEAFKNFRWQVVLARIDARRGERETSRSEYLAAIKLEPQFDWLYTELANLYLEDGLYEEVIKVYEDLAELSPDPAVWHMKIAELMFRSGRRDEAIARAMRSIEGKPPEFPPYFQLADFLLEWNAPDKAEIALNGGIERFLDDPYARSLNSSNAETMLKIMVRARGFKGAFTYLVGLQNKLSNVANSNNKKPNNMIYRSMNAIGNSLGRPMANELNLRGNAADRRDLEQLYQESVGYGDDDFQISRDFAGTAHMPDLERKLLEKWVEIERNNKYNSYISSAESTLELFLKARRDYAGLEKLDLNRYTRYRYYYYPALACIYRITGRTDDEIRMLKTYLSSSSISLGGFSGYNDAVHRLVELLLENRREKDLDELTRISDGFTGYILNEFIAVDRKDLALATVDLACKGKGDLWQKAKSALIYTYFKDTGSRPQQLFKSILAIEPIDAAMNRHGKDMLTGNMWTLYAWHYGRFLDIAGKSEYTKWLAAVPEDSPRDENAYMKFGDYMYDHKRYAEALAKYELAEQLKPALFSVISREGKALYRKGDKKGAFEVLQTILKPDLPGTYMSYSEILVELGEAERANETLRKYLVEVWPKNLSGSDEVLDILIDAWKEDNGKKQALLKQLTALRPKDLSLPDKVISQKWLAGPDLDFFYELIIGIIEGESPINEPLRNEWRGRYQRHLVESAEYQKALGIIDENERLGALDENAATLARAEVYLKWGRLDQARAELKKTLGPEPIPAFRYEPAVSLLISVGPKEEAERWLREMLELYIKGGSRDAGHYTRLAEVYYKGQEAAKADDLLEKMIRLYPENPTGLRSAAELAAKYGSYQKALEWRRRLEPLAPADDANRFEIAWLTGKTGNLTEMVKMVLQMIDDRSVTNTVRSQMAERIPPLLAGNAALAGELSGKLEAKLKNFATDPGYLMLANLSSSDRGRYESILKDALKNLTQAIECTLALARFYAGEKKYDDASQYYYMYIYRNPGAPSVFIELTETELKRGKPRLAMAALPVQFKEQYYTVFDSSDIQAIASAVAGRWSDRSEQAAFFLELAKTAEGLDWMDSAIALANRALQLTLNSKNAQSANEADGGERRRGFFGRGEPSSGELESRIREYLRATEDKRTARRKKLDQTLRITSDLEN